MTIPPTPVEQFPNVPNAPGIPPMNRNPSASPVAAPILLVSDAAQIISMFLTPQWGIYDGQGNPVLASSSTLDQIVGSLVGEVSQIGSLLGLSGNATFTVSTGAVDFRQDYDVSDAPQEQGAFLSYNKVQRPYESRITFFVGGTSGQRSAFLATVAALCASLNLYTLVTPDSSYPNLNLKHYDLRREAIRGVSLLTVDVWAQQIRIVGTTAYSNTGTPSGANQMNSGTVQPLQVQSNSLPVGAPT